MPIPDPEPLTRLRPATRRREPHPLPFSRREWFLVLVVHLLLALSLLGSLRVTS